jgi:hypothetical protein
MIIFVRRLVLFALLFSIITVGLVGSASLYMNSVKFKIDPAKNILVIGDSHTECAIDDSSFRRAANFSKSATAYIYSIAALRKLIADNPQIDTVLLSFHSSSLLYEREESWIYDEVAMARQVPVFLPYFSVAEYSTFLFNPQFYKPAFQTPWSAWDYYQSDKKGLRQDWIDQNIGNFRDFSWNNFSKDTAATKPLEDRETRFKVSTLMVEHIRRIEKICKENNLTLVLINTPVYQWNKYVNDVEFEENRKKYLGDLLFVDYSDFPVADSCRFDIWHLNGIGARQFSSYLERNIAKDIKKQFATLRK